MGSHVSTEMRQISFPSSLSLSSFFSFFSLAWNFHQAELEHRHFSSIRQAFIQCPIHFTGKQLNKPQSASNSRLSQTTKNPWDSDLLVLNRSLNWRSSPRHPAELVSTSGNIFRDRTQTSDWAPIQGTESWAELVAQTMPSPKTQENPQQHRDDQLVPFIASYPRFISYRGIPWAAITTSSCASLLLLDSPTCAIDQRATSGSMEKDPRPASRSGCHLLHTS